MTVHRYVRQVAGTLIVLLVLVWALIGVGGFRLAQTEIGDAQEQLLRRGGEAVASSSNDWEERLRDIVADIVFLDGLPALHACIDLPRRENLASVSETFSA